MCGQAQTRFRVPLPPAAWLILLPKHPSRPAPADTLKSSCLTSTTFLFCILEPLMALEKLTCDTAVAQARHSVEAAEARGERSGGVERCRRGGERKEEKNRGGRGGNTEVSKPSVTSDHPPLPQLSPRSGGGSSPSRQPCVRGHGAPDLIV